LSLASVQAYFAVHAPEIEVLEVDASLATVQAAAAALDVAPGQIAKSLTLQIDDQIVILVMRGDARLDNRKFRQRFGVKPRMLDPAAVERATGHPVGGVCPFGLLRDLAIYCDVSLQAFAEVFPSGGAPHTAGRLEPHRLAALTGAEWVDVAQFAPEEA
jgi:prolyl-tRNA editing enzyme YbaK/EbsC (Cys-tRNA(Pro) deacylase)